MWAWIAVVIGLTLPATAAAGACGPIVPNDDLPTQTVRELVAHGGSAIRAIERDVGDPTVLILERSRNGEARISVLFCDLRSENPDPIELSAPVPADDSTRLFLEADHVVRDWPVVVAICVGPVGPRVALVENGLSVTAGIGCSSGGSIQQLVNDMAAAALRDAKSCDAAVGQVAGDPITSRVLGRRLRQCATAAVRRGG